jgi:triacylglycerol lipase
MLNDPLAAQMGLLVMRAEDMFNLLNNAQQQEKLDPQLDSALTAAYDLRGYIIGNDAIAELNPATARRRLRVSDNIVFYGFVARSRANPHQSVAVVRGTGSLLEWIKDAEFAPVPHPLSGGQVEQGFDSIYRTMRYRAYAGGEFTGEWKPIAQGIAEEIPDGKVTVVGHSLGSALATYLALELVVSQKMADRATTCMFASPRPGDTPFVDFFDQHLANYTLYNYSRDAVPMVPLLFGYSSLPRAIKITPDTAQADIRYDPLLPIDINNLACQHHVVCYAAMLDYHAADWGSLPAIDQDCARCIIGPKNLGG